MSQTKTRKKWKSSEDRILRSGLKEGKSATEVAQILGRSPGSVTQRKMMLGLAGTFRRHSQNGHSQIQLALPAAVQPEVSANGIEIFKIESGVAMPTKFTPHFKEKEKIYQLLRQIQPNQSFIIPGNLTNATRFIVQKEFPQYKIRIVRTTDDKKFARVFRLA
jgi:hypothetical protein